jgi:hypothetical protein
LLKVESNPWRVMERDHWEKACAGFRDRLAAEQNPKLRSEADRQMEVLEYWGHQYGWDKCRGGGRR